MNWSADDSIAVASCLQVAVLVVAAVIAFRQASEARRLRIERGRPYVIVHLERSKASWRILNLVVENTGATAARNVRLKIEPPLETTFHGAHPRDWRVITDGIPVLVPGARHWCSLDNVTDRFKRPELPTQYRAVVSFEGNVPRDNYQDEFVLDLGLGRGGTYVEEKGLHQIAEALETLHGSLIQLIREDHP